MAREFAKKLYTSNRWRKCRASFIAERIAIDGGLCQVCRKELGYIVHHKTWLTPKNINDPIIVYGHDNLEYVGLVCHNKIGTDGEDEKFYFNDVGEFVPLVEKNTDSPLILKVGGATV